jgi:hypothetical protein
VSRGVVGEQTADSQTGITDAARVPHVTTSQATPAPTVPSDSSRRDVRTSAPRAKAG